MCGNNPVIKCTFFILIILLNIHLIFSQTNIVWMKEYGGLENEDLRDFIQTSDGGYILVGQTSSFGAGGSDIWVLKVNSDGDSIWTNIIGEVDDDYCSSVVQTNDGGYVVSGQIGNEINGSLIKIDASGDLLWSKKINREIRYNSIFQTSESDLIVLGDSVGCKCVLKFDDTGENLWKKTYDCSGSSAFYTGQVTDDGSSFILAGQHESCGSLYKIDTDGEVVWEQRYVRNYSLIFKDMIQDNSGIGFILLGMISDGKSKIGVFKTDVNGDSVWCRQYEINGELWGNSIQSTIDGGYIIGSKSWYNNEHYANRIIKTYSDGEIEWTYEIPNTSYGHVLQTTNGDYIVAGHKTNGEQSDFFIAKLANPASIPKIVSINPLQNQLNVKQNTEIVVEFDRDIDESTINSSTFVVHASQTGLHTGSYSYNSSTKTATLIPDREFAVGELISVTLTSGIQSSDGYSIMPFQWRFTAKVDGGSGTFANKEDYSTGSDPWSVIISDLDGDGDGDLVTANSSGSVSVLMNHGDGTFSEKVEYSTGTGSRHIYASDLDGDGDGDLVVAIASHSSMISILMNNGDGTFASSVNYETESAPYSVFSSDLNRDGSYDLVTSNFMDNTVSVFLNNGDGTFTERVEYSTGTSPFSVYVADLDGDGSYDLVTSNSMDNTVSVFINNGDGTFGQKTDYTTGNQPKSVFSSDLDSDGDMDLTVANSGTDDISILLNNGDGTFQSKIDYSVGKEPTSIFASDLNSDGKMDLITANYSDSTVSILINNGAGTFSTMGDYQTGWGPRSVISADLDQDGDMEIITANWSSNTISILSNRSAFSSRISIDYMSKHSDTIQISYRISNPENNPTSILCEYSINDGSIWSLATVVSDTAGISPENYEGDILWDSYSDLPGFDLNTVRFKITPYDQTGYGRPDSVAFHLDNNLIPSITLTEIIGEQRLDINIQYQLSDIENDILGLFCEFYDPSSEIWEPASIFGDTSGLTNYSNQITWNSNNDLPEAYGNHLFRITPYDNDPGISDTVVIFLDQLGLPVASSISQFLEEQSGDIEISFTLSDDEGDTITIIPEYSVNSGETWSPATISGDYEELSSEQYSGSFTWHSKSDLPGIDIATVRFRITPDDGNIGIPIETADFHLDNNLPPQLLSLTCPDSIAVKGTIEFSLSDPENDTLSLYTEYSTDDGTNWYGGVMGKEFESIIPQNYTGSYEWFTYESFGFNRLNDIQIKFTVYDNDPGTDTTLKNISILNYPAEFTGDLVIDTDDLAIFASAWNADPQDTLYEIGPATGVVPELIPEPDGVLDFEDLAVFIMMWNWSFEHNGFLAKHNFLAKASSNPQFIRLVQRYVDDPWNANGIITVDVIPESPDVMMVDGTFYLNQSSLKLLSVQNGDYLKQAYQATPSFRQFNSDSSAFLYAVTGLGRIFNSNIESSPIITLRFKNSAEDNLHLSFEYNLRNDDGEIIESSGISTTLISMIPSQYSLRQNYPNPFNPSTTIRYEIPTESFVTITVYDILGRQVKTLIRKEHIPGYHEVHWNGKDQSGKQVASGMYFYHLYSKDYSKIQKMVLLR